MEYAHIPKPAAGMKFARLTLLGPSETAKEKWLCQCDCGVTKEIRIYRVTQGITRSCGCFNRERAVETNTTHGQARAGGTRTYAIWGYMLNRCNNPSYEKFDRYGGRGIKVCERWHDFASFFADMGESPKGQSIDRIDNDKGYEPGNCEWSTVKKQNRNKSNITMIDYRGERRKLIDLCEEAGLRPETVRRRLQTGMPLEAALSAPVRWSSRSAATPSPV